MKSAHLHLLNRSLSLPLTEYSTILPQDHNYGGSLNAAQLLNCESPKIQWRELQYSKSLPSCFLKYAAYFSLFIIRKKEKKSGGGHKEKFMKKARTK